MRKIKGIPVQRMNELTVKKKIDANLDLSLCLLWIFYAANHFPFSGCFSKMC
jgi:hypothetical protein